MKILKVLIQELLSASGSGNAANSAAAMASAAAEYESDDGDDTWEDEADILHDLGLGSRADLLAFDSDGGRLKDDETQAYLTDFFVGAARDNLANFQEWYGMFTDEERAKLEELAASKPT